MATNSLSQLDWDQRFLNLADHISTWSRDPSTKVGSVIVNAKRHILAVGYNGFPRGVRDSASRYADKSTKYKFVSHAERNALDNAHLDVEGCTLYASLFPCNECAKSIIQRGIRRVVTRRPTEQKPEMNWDITDKMFKEAGVSLIQI